MSSSSPSSSWLLLSFYLFFQFTCAWGGVEWGLKIGYYDSSCPGAEDVVRYVIAARYNTDPTIAPALIRLHFHDCFVRGCDASILLDRTPSGQPAEKESAANGISLNENSLDVIDFAKYILESRCPATVSCADILAFAARDAAELAGLHRYLVPSGRKDGNASLAMEVSLPGPHMNLQQLTQVFAKRGFSQSEMVVLSGAHSIGGVHCNILSADLYNFTDGQPQDPSLQPLYAEYLKSKCPAPGSLLEAFSREGKVNFGIDKVEMKLDNSYYQELEQGRGLLASDRALMTGIRTKTIVSRMARDPTLWAKKFAKAMRKVGTTNVLLDDAGDVRRHCRFLNQK